MGNPNLDSLGIEERIFQQARFVLEQLGTLRFDNALGVVITYKCSVSYGNTTTDIFVIEALFDSKSDQIKQLSIRLNVPKPHDDYPLEFAVRANDRIVLPPRVCTNFPKWTLVYHWNNIPHVYRPGDWVTYFSHRWDALNAKIRNKQSLKEAVVYDGDLLDEIPRTYQFE